MTRTTYGRGRVEIPEETLKEGRMKEIVLESGNDLGLCGAFGVTVGPNVTLCGCVQEYSHLGMTRSGSNLDSLRASILGL